jgi:signal-transduction protein with cAMP-binding, CBS, and nucleotidyltransferase domain
MKATVKEVMTREPVTLPAQSSASDAARAMSQSSIGAVVVTDSAKICGIVTDRDIVVRAIAEGKDPKKVRIGDICSHDLTTLRPDDTVNEVVALMRKKAIRRLPVVEGSEAVGIVSIGDLAQRLDRSSALADISAAQPNH